MAVFHMCWKPSPFPVTFLQIHKCCLALSDRSGNQGPLDPGLGTWHFFSFCVYTTPGISPSLNVDDSKIYTLARASEFNFTYPDSHSTSSPGSNSSNLTSKSELLCTRTHALSTIQGDPFNSSFLHHLSFPSPKLVHQHTSILLFLPS